MDAMTEARKNLEFARLCIEVDLDEQSPDEVFPKLGDGSKAKVEVEYASKPLQCLHCRWLAILKGIVP